MGDMRKVGPQPADWDKYVDCYPYGRDLVIADGGVHGKHKLFKFHIVAWDDQYLMIPLPNDKEELKRILLDIATNEGIDL